MLLIGMKTSLMIYPTTPITANPTAHELAILVNSKELKKKYIPALSGLVHLLTNQIDF
jgi:hypothetical protein